MAVGARAEGSRGASSTTVPGVSVGAAGGVLLVCGVLAYVGVMRELGTIDFVGNSVSSIGIPMLSALLLGYIGAVISAFATSSGVITALVSLVMPLLAGRRSAPSR